MKKLKDYEEFVNESDSKEQNLLIKLQRQWLDDHVNGTWMFSTDGSVRTYGDVKIESEQLEHIPVNFAVINGNLKIRNCKFLKTLHGCPTRVSGFFSCKNCLALRTLEHVPQFIGESFHLDDCTMIDSLMGGPAIVGQAITLQNIHGIPKAEKTIVEMGTNDLKKWWKSKQTAEQYVNAHRGRIKGKKFRI